MKLIKNYQSFIWHEYLERNKMEKSLLLSDETELSVEDYNERKTIIEEFQKLPEEFFAKLRHFQPQIGCLNCCKICSKFANSRVSYWNENRIRNVVAALKFTCMDFRSKKPYIVWDRDEHRSGVIFSYLDNDIGNYYYLDKFIKIVYDELGVKTRISTVGFSRYNEKIKELHIKINCNEILDCLAGVRLSFTPYEIGWESGYDSQYFSRNEYMQDMAEFLKIYKPYYDKVGAGSRKMCVELRYKPLAVKANVIVKVYNGYLTIATGNYLYVSCDKNCTIKESQILDVYDHTIKLTEEPQMFYVTDLDCNVCDEDDLDCIMEKYDASHKQKVVNVYMLKNADGEYYSIDPSISDIGNYGINIYPKTCERKQSGYLITERFFLNALYEYKKSIGIKAMDCFNYAEWRDVDKVVNILKQYAFEYERVKKYEKSIYINTEILPMIKAYISALKIADYKPVDIFNPDFTIDTGIICNMGRALKEFCGLTQKVNEPLTPTHERNYGYHNSTMTKEGIAWRLSCDYGDNLLIEKLSLKDTASEDGQVVMQKRIELSIKDEKTDMSCLKSEYLVPGQIKHK